MVGFLELPVLPVHLIVHPALPKNRGLSHIVDGILGCGGRSHVTTFGTMCHFFSSMRVTMRGLSGGKWSYLKFEGMAFTHRHLYTFHTFSKYIDIILMIHHGIVSRSRSCRSLSEKTKDR